MRVPGKPCLRLALSRPSFGRISSRHWKPPRSEWAREPDAHLKVDTGMSRLGALPGEVPALLSRARALGIELSGVMSHFANADLRDAAVTERQLEVFARVLAQVEAAGFHPRWRHMANSAAVVALPPAKALPPTTLFVRDSRSTASLRPHGLCRPPLGARPQLEDGGHPREDGAHRDGGLVRRHLDGPSADPNRHPPVGYADGYPRRLSTGPRFWSADSGPQSLEESAWTCAWSM